MDTNGHSGAAAPSGPASASRSSTPMATGSRSARVLSEQLRRTGDDDGPDMGEVLPESAPHAEAPSGVGR